MENKANQFGIHEKWGQALSIGAAWRREIGSAQEGSETSEKKADLEPQILSHGEATLAQS